MTHSNILTYPMHGANRDELWGKLGQLQYLVHTYTHKGSFIRKKKNLKAINCTFNCMLLCIHANVHCGQQEQHLFFPVTNFQQKINSTNVLYQQEIPIDYIFWCFQCSLLVRVTLQSHHSVEMLRCQFC